MIPEAYKKFLREILERTNNGEVQWENDYDQSLYLRTKTATVELGQYSDADAELSFYYFKYNNYSKKKDASFRVSHLEDDYAIMEKLYTVAAASATNVGDELKDFLKEL